MRIQEITGKDLILPAFKPATRTESLRELVGLIAERRGLSPIQIQTYLLEVLRRHDRIPCGLGRGLAFPNARIVELARPILAIGLSAPGLDFGGPDGRPAHAILLYLGRAQAPEDERRMLSCLSLSLADPDVARKLVSATTIDDVWNAVLSLDAAERAGAR